MKFGVSLPFKAGILRRRNTVLYPLKQAMDKEFTAKFSKEWVESWNAHDLEMILSHYSDDFEIESPLALERFPESGGKITGKEHVRTYWNLGLQLNPDLEFELLNVLSGVNSISIYYLSKSSKKRVIETMVFNPDLKVCRAIVNYE
ncbi:MAG: nuclear transport factor 2 family protein [Phaeodactylibacter sp.]|nr:nuclear transport factor 2 family protein [Phaeodactylibacter sp.]